VEELKWADLLVVGNGLGYLGWGGLDCTELEPGLVVGS